MSGFNPETIKYHLHEIDSLGLQYAWTSSLLPSLVNYMRPDLVISEYKQCASSINTDLLDLLSQQVSNIGELYEYDLAYVNKDLKKKLGQYYTPYDVGAFMSSQLLDIIYEDSQQLEYLRFVEPCCGCGGLLFPLFDETPVPWKLINDNLELYDLDETAIEIAKISLIIRYAPSEARVSLSDITSYTGDFLANKRILNENDVIIANPPYGHADISSYGTYRTSISADLYALFMEKCSTAGFVSIITPQSFLGARKFQSLRNVLMERASGIVYPFDNVPSPIFCGRKHGIFNTNTSNSVRAAITCMRGDGKGDWRVAPLMRFKAEERNDLFGKVLEIADEATKQSSPAIWYKIPRCLDKALFSEKNITLGDIVSDKGEDAPYHLTVPATPRYYTSASVMPLERASKFTLSFSSREMMEIAYLAINSSLVYGWWRACDGGITISEKTVLSTPLPPLDTLDIKAISARFEEQVKLEPSRKVVKKNAGKPNENISIGQDEIDANTRLVLPGLTEKEYRAFRGFHENNITGAAGCWA